MKDESQKQINIKFILPCGTEKNCNAFVGENILTVAKNYDLPLEGACGGSLACATCHVALEKKHFESLAPASEEEEDMLDMAFNLEETSRLGCQVYLNENYGWV